MNCTAFTFEPVDESGTYIGTSGGISGLEFGETHNLIN